MDEKIKSDEDFKKNKEVKIPGWISKEERLRELLRRKGMDTQQVNQAMAEMKVIIWGT